MNKTFAFAASLVALATACGGQTNVGTDARPAPDPRSPSSTAESAFSAADVMSAQSKCNATHGDADRYGSVDELVARLSGHWLFCPGEATALGTLQDGTKPIGVEFTDDGHFYWLLADASGAAVRGRGIAGAASYEIKPPFDAQLNNNSYQITVWYADRSQMGTYATFEAGPRRLALQFFFGLGYFVPLGHGATSST